MIRAVRVRAARLRRNEDGFALPEVIISVIVNGLCLTVIATAVITFLALQTNIEKSSASVTEMTLSGTAWRADTKDASAVAVTDATRTQFTVPNADGTCRETTWTVATVGAGRQVLRDVVNYPTTDPGTLACTGTPGPVVAQTFLRDAAADAAFTFTNPSGRGITFTAGSPTLAAGTAPAGTSAGQWASLAVGMATLTATASASSEKPVNVNISQVAVSLPRTAPPAATTGTPDAGSTHATQ